MRRYVEIVLVLICLTFIISCGKRYVGYRINEASPIWCHYLNGENHYTRELGGLVFEFAIRKGEADGEYIIEGYIDPTQGRIKSWDQFVESQSFFSMVVADNGVIVDNVSFRPRSAYGGLNRKMPFKITYNRPEGFDAVTFDWRMLIRG